MEPSPSAKVLFLVGDIGYAFHDEIGSFLLYLWKNVSLKLHLHAQILHMCANIHTCVTANLLGVYMSFWRVSF